MIAVILAGGKGVRLWPESRKNRPKQLCKFVDDRSMLDHTMDRLFAIGFHRILIITHMNLMDDITRLTANRPEKDRIQVITEPQSKNTASAAGLALSTLQAENPQQVVGFFPADHHIMDTASFRQIIERSVQASQYDQLIMLGVSPHRPETGYGYIEKAKYEFSQLPGVFPVESFCEKPDQPTADVYLAGGKHIWNVGIYIGKISTFMEEYAKHLPFVYSYIIRGLDTYLASYKNLPDLSLDCGIAEKSYRIAVIPGDFGWCDLGSWNALSELYPSDAADNTIHGQDVLALDSQKCLVKQTEKTVILYKVQDLLIVESDHVILVTPRSAAQEIKSLVQELEQKERFDLL